MWVEEEPVRREQEALLLFNPHSGKIWGRNRLSSALSYLSEYRWRVTIHEIGHPSEAEAVARDAAAGGWPIVVAAGGDGTVNEVIQGLAGSDTVLGILPLGTGNRSALQMGIPANMAAAARVLTHGHIRAIDLGEVEDRYFLYGAGVGFDALVAQHTTFALKRTLGVASYVVVAFFLAFSYSGAETTIATPDRLWRGEALQVTVGNARLYGDYAMVTPRAEMDDGLLDVCVFKGQGRGRVFRHIVNVLAHRHLLDPAVEYYRVPQLSISSGKGLLVQADGDILKETPVALRIVPRCLKVLVPATGGGRYSAQQPTHNPA